MNNLPLTQALIDQARASTFERTSSRDKSDWIQYADDKASGIQVEVRVNGNKLHRETQKIVRTTFWYGSLRITRALAEERIAAATPKWDRVDESDHIDSVTGDYK